LRWDRDCGAGCFCQLQSARRQTPNASLVAASPCFFQNSMILSLGSHSVCCCVSIRLGYRFFPRDSRYCSPFRARGLGVPYELRSHMRCYGLGPQCNMMVIYYMSIFNSLFLFRPGIPRRSHSHTTPRPLSQILLFVGPRGNRRSLELDVGPHSGRGLPLACLHKWSRTFPGSSPDAISGCGAVSAQGGNGGTGDVLQEVD
jgi:hypothetical protein